MTSVFDLFRSGYLLGQKHGQSGRRRSPEWELFVTHPLLWLPLVDLRSYLKGYREGYKDMMHTKALVAQFTK
jgi:hypothetical protein